MEEQVTRGGDLDFALNMLSVSCLRDLSGQLYPLVGSPERSSGVRRSMRKSLCRRGGAEDQGVSERGKEARTRADGKGGD